MVFPRVVALAVLLILSKGAAAGLDDDFIYSSKFGLLTETVTSSWTTLDSGLAYGGFLNGIPRDSWQELYFLNGKLSLVSMGYLPDPLFFETEAAYHRWLNGAFKALLEKGSQKYGLPQSEDASCESNGQFELCSGTVLWVGDRKFFQISMYQTSPSDIEKSFYGFSVNNHLNFEYGDVQNLGFIQSRAASLRRERMQRFSRTIEGQLRDLLEPILRREGISLEDYLAQLENPYAKIRDIRRKTSVTYEGGVKANYTPDRWVRSFRLQ